MYVYVCVKCNVCIDEGERNSLVLSKLDCQLGSSVSNHPHQAEICVETAAPSFVPK